jgi:hypothetical protein
MPATGERLKYGQYTQRNSSNSQNLFSGKSRKSLTPFVNPQQGVIDTDSCSILLEEKYKNRERQAATQVAFLITLIGVPFVDPKQMYKFYLKFSIYIAID